MTPKEHLDKLLRLFQAYDRAVQLSMRTVRNLDEWNAEQWRPISDAEDAFYKAYYEAYEECE